MAYHKEQNDINDHLRKFNHLKKSIIPVLLCSPLFCFLYFRSPSLVQSFDPYFSVFSFTLFTDKPERNYAFLLFNGILVLIIGFSGPTRRIIPKDRSDETEETEGPDHHFQEKKVNTVKQVEFVSGDHGEEEDDDYSLKNGGEDEREDEEEEEGSVEEELMSRDELNKKCEDFIKKVKQEIQWQFQYLTR